MTRMLIMSPPSSVLHLQRRQRNDVNHVRYAAAAGEVIEGLGKALADGADSVRAGEALHQLIADEMCIRDRPYSA